MSQYSAALARIAFGLAVGRLLPVVRTAMVPGRRRPLLGGQVAEFLGLSLSADEMVLEAAANGGATHLLTWNIKDVGPASIFGINVLTPTAFLALQPDEES